MLSACGHQKPLYGTPSRAQSPTSRLLLSDTCTQAFSPPFGQSLTPQADTPNKPPPLIRFHCNRIRQEILDPQGVQRNQAAPNAGPSFVSLFWGLQPMREEVSAYGGATLSGHAAKLGGFTNRPSILAVLGCASACPHVQGVPSCLLFLALRCKDSNVAECILMLKSATPVFGCPCM